MKNQTLHQASSRLGDAARRRRWSTDYQLGFQAAARGLGGGLPKCAQDFGVHGSGGEYFGGQIESRRTNREHRRSGCYRVYFQNNQWGDQIVGDKEPKDMTRSGNSLRLQAEAMLNAFPADITTVTAADIEHLLHEFQIHQIELELQNEQLREAHLELLSSRDHLADLYDFAPVGYLTLDRAGFVIEANLATVDLLGVTRDKLLCSKFSDFLAPESQDTAYFYWQKVFSTIERQRVELRLLRQDGEPLIVMLESIAFQGSAPPKSRCRVALIDTTDLNNLRESLISLNAKLEHRVDSQVQEIRLMASALANLKEGVLISSDHNDWSESKVIFANDAMCKYLGFTLEEVRGQTPDALLRKLIDTSALARLADQISTSLEYQGELIYTSMDAGIGAMELSILPLVTTESQRVHFVAVLRDTTARKRQELALHEQKEQLQAIQDAVLDAIITIDQKGIIQACNKGLERVFGYTVMELLGRNISLLMPEPYRQAHDGHLRRYLETGETHIIGGSRELTALHKDGHSFPIALSVSEVDHLGLYTGVVRDISEKKKLQREVLLADSEVRWRIGQALHDGPQQELGGLSLVARGLAMDLARQGSPLAAKAKELSKRLTVENKHISLLARGLIPVPIGDRGLMVALTSLASKLSEEFDVSCKFECPEPIHIVNHYVEDQLYHIAKEAVLNAANHSGAGHIVIHLGEQGNNIYLRVEDDGSGIIKAKHKRHGLGLHIMPYRAATIGASIDFSDRTGGGTVVDCILDRCHVVAGA